jgi:CheY-like chemotaxis protein
MSIGTIPLQATQAAIGLTATPHPVRTQTTASLGVKLQTSLLIIDDNADDVRVLRLALKWMRSPIPFSVRVSEDCETTLNELCCGNGPLPSVILLDLERQGKRCLRALDRLKQTKRSRAIPVIIMARPAQHGVEDSYAACANCVVRKPETVEEAEQLLTRIERFWFQAATLPAANHSPSIETRA